VLVVARPTADVDARVELLSRLGARLELSSALGGRFVATVRL
jgi:hypothetical protein